MLVRTTSRPSSSSQPRAPWVSSAAWVTRAVCQVPVTVAAAAARPAVDVADLAVGLGDDVALRLGDPGLDRGLVAVQQRSAGGAGRLGVEDGRQHVVLDLDQRRRELGGGHGLGDDGGDPLAAEAHDVVEHPGVVGVVEPAVVAGGGVEDVGDVEVGEHEAYAGRRCGAAGVDARDPGVGVRALHERHVQHAGRRAGRACRARCR